jgi:adenylosuccinate lyase
LDDTRFEHPLAERYASAEMLAIWSPARRYGLWRRIWLALAESEHELGLPVTAAQIDALKKAAESPIDFAAVARYERELRHDVMAHVHALGDAAPAARGVIHLGATSMDVVDNADLLLTRDALALLLERLVAVAQILADFCEKNAGLPALGYTHLQPAQLTTVGKRASLWLADLVQDIETVHRLRANLRCRGLRGATGTQASFLKLLGSPERVAELEKRFAAKLGFDACYPVVGQTYSRKVDVEITGALASFGASVHKLCNDIRLLAMVKEMEEPFGRSQIGSSAMPYKRNPARSERATGLARFLMNLAPNMLMTLSAQMFERTLDDSSNKRLVFPEAFLAADAVACILHNIVDGLVLYPATIAARVAAELPFIATENILMAAVAAGADRQDVHERIRQHSQLAGEQVKQHAAPNDLLTRLKNDPAFNGVDFDAVMDPASYVGLAPQQTREFVADVRRTITRLGVTPRKPEDLRV